MVIGTHHKHIKAVRGKKQMNGFNDCDYKMLTETLSGSFQEYSEQPITIDRLCFTSEDKTFHISCLLRLASIQPALNHLLGNCLRSFTRQMEVIFERTEFSSDEDGRCVIHAIFFDFFIDEMHELQRVGPDFVLFGQWMDDARSSRPHSTILVLVV